MAVQATDIVEMTIGGAALQQRVFNIRHWEPNPGWNSSDPGAALANVGTILATHFQNAWLGVLPTQYTIPFYLFRTIVNHTVAIGGKRKLVYNEAVEQRPFPAPVGARVGEVLPAHVAVSYILRTGLAGKRRRGAMRIGPIRELDQADGINTDAVSYSAAAAAYFVAVPVPGAGSLSPVVFSKADFFLQTTTINPSLAAFPIVQTLMPLPLKSQVSRKPKTVTLG